jgi:phenylacetate-CoA ligase
VNKGIARIVYKTGCRLRGTPVLYYLGRLKESQWWSDEELAAAQLEKLRSLLAHAREHSPFYREHFERHRFDCDIGSLDDLKALPSLGKRDIAPHRERIQNKGRGGRLIYSKSAGTTSIPLSFYRTADWDAQHRAAMMRGYSWYGVEPWAPHGRLWSVPPKLPDRIKARIGDYLLNRFRQRSFDLDHATLEAFYRRLAGAEYLAGYSHQLFEFARYINAKHPGDPPLGLKLVKGTSEKIYPHYQPEARRAFGRPITSEYGASEIGIIGFECPEGSLHVTMEHVILEVEDGEIVLTNLLSYSFPFIRYRLGDYVTLKAGFACRCGRKGIVLDEIVGRVGFTIRGKRGRVFPSVAIDLIMKALGSFGPLVAQCQAVQKEEGRLDFYVVPGAVMGRADRARIERFFGEIVPKYYGEAIEHRVEFVQSIPRPGRKFLEFVSEIEPRDT